MKDNLLGTVVDNRFEIQKRIGEGGMGTVYQAWQRSIGREIAIKMIDGRVATDMTAAKRFLREARLASKLAHPNTISMIDFGQCDDGRLFIAMELLRGVTLDKVIEKGPITADRVLAIATQITDALVAAHKLQIIHRDLKLENVMLLDDVSRGDFVKVLDFGLAKSLDKNDGERAGHNSTRAGIVVGTPQYLTPESMTGAPPTVSNDLYALGVMLGELATGKQLWNTTDFTELCGLKMSKPPELSSVTEPLRGLIRRLVAPRLADRPVDAVAVANELNKIRSAPQAAIPDLVESGEVIRPSGALPRVEIQPIEIVEFDQVGAGSTGQFVEWTDTTSGGTPIDIRFRPPGSMSQRLGPRTQPVPIQRSAVGSDTNRPKHTPNEGTGAVVKQAPSRLLWIAILIALLAAGAIIFTIATSSGKGKPKPRPAATEPK